MAAHGTTLRLRMTLAAAAVALSAVAAAATGTFPVPFYVGIFYVGPLAFLWFVLPGVLAPILVTKLGVNRRQLPSVLVLTALAFAASITYLLRASTWPSNLGRESGFFFLWVAVFALAVLAAIGYLRESRVATCAYHLTLLTWFFGFGFPYLGEFL